MNEFISPNFPLGQLVATPNALARITRDDIMAALRRHLSGDWGDVCAEDKQTNDRAIMEGTWILSSYQAANGTRFWIITEGDRSVTTVLLPEDY
jgi:hypothetical protein